MVLSTEKAKLVLSKEKAKLVLSTEMEGASCVYRDGRSWLCLQRWEELVVSTEMGEAGCVYRDEYGDGRDLESAAVPLRNQFRGSNFQLRSGVHQMNVIRHPLSDSHCHSNNRPTWPAVTMLAAMSDHNALCNEWSQNTLQWAITSLNAMGDHNDRSNKQSQCSSYRSVTVLATMSDHNAQCNGWSQWSQQ